MLTRKLRNMLEKPPMKGRSGGTVKSHVFIVGKRMVPAGCESLVCLSSRKPEMRQQRRVVFHGLAPGDVIRAPARFFNMIVEERRLPKPQHCWLIRANCMKRGLLWTRPSPPPCAHHMSVSPCTRCPWMSVVPAVAPDIKAGNLRHALESLPHVSPIGGEGFAGSEELGGVRVDSTGCRPLPRLSLNFLEPFSAPIKLHLMREVEFHFHHTHDPKDVNRGTASKSVPVGGRFRFLDSQPDATGCLLCTLEQDRLLKLLNLWADCLPLHVQKCLCSVFVLQHPHEAAEHSWDCDLHVALLLQKDTVMCGEQSPLCGPSQPDTTLSREEQQFVDAVLSAAPLTTNIGVSTVCTDGSVAHLYPHARRVDVFASTELAALSLPFVAAAAAVNSCFPCKALHGPTERAVTASLPFMHSVLAFALEGRDLGSLQSTRCPSAWRHAASLEAVGSVVLSLISERRISGDGNVMLLGGGSVARGGRRGSGSQLLLAGLVQWLGALFPQCAVHVLGENRGEGGLPVVCIFVIDNEADVDLLMGSLRDGKGFGLRESVTQLSQLVLLQLSFDGEFRSLVDGLSAIQRCLGGKKALHVDAGIIDVDPWAATVVGYAAVEI
ncbi:hypothetical protein, conserved [Trypanosoma brucei gambiense DAL972]|uniref:Uncharacterized protein n=1 Tax=Trypanosoma brucei gambiense (strain MHOM/CI/86/DAL972) TaxID=679716 RepID=D0AAQ1_TRYB9|nr:hypothetical protein, conserved [Trypanosoma brucei gambiense DAL972]CBH18752.1 hypothetical protein, conserved [Trypanosoma brucei gambiense DAL972]|eukprot:XP_011781016.1 hypothetical protein, conserved [Trypanosoma brucei gambiense DAL972]